MLKYFFVFAAVTFFIVACNNEKKQDPSSQQKAVSQNPDNIPETNTPPAITPPQSDGSPSVAYTVDGTGKTTYGSALVQKDEDKLSPGNDHFAIISANSAGESFVINFVFALKPGVYPVVGLGYSKDKQVFGGLLGGKKKIMPYQLKLTECENLGSNNSGGNKWRISGEIEGEVTIDAMGIMKLDKEHPASIKASNIRFANLTFDDNWEELMNKALDKLEKKN